MILQPCISLDSTTADDGANTKDAMLSKTNRHDITKAAKRQTLEIQHTQHFIGTTLRQSVNHYVTTDAYSAFSVHAFGPSQ